MDAQRDVRTNDHASVYGSHGAPTWRAALKALAAPVAERARGATVHCSGGRDYLDFASGGFGYGHPHVLQAVAKQLRELPLSSRMFFNRHLALVTKRIAQLTDSRLPVSYPCNSSAEAVDGAIKLAKGYNRTRARIVTAGGAHRGTLMGTLGTSGLAGLRRAFSDLPLSSTIIPYGDVDAMVRVIDRDTSAIVIEPISTAMQVVVPELGYLRAVREQCSRTGTVMIVDESHTGLGRTGTFFGFERDDIMPDIIVLGEALGGGVLPVGAYVASRRINDAVYNKRHPALHGSTTGGNPVACVAALAALDVVENERVSLHALDVEVALQAWSVSISRGTREIRDFSCRGMTAAFSVATTSFGRAIQEAAFHAGVLVRCNIAEDGRCWIGLHPPLIVSGGEVRTALERLTRAIRTLSNAQPDADVSATGGAT